MSRGSEESPFRALWHATDAVDRRVNIPNLISGPSVKSSSASPAAWRGAPNSISASSIPGNAPIGCVKRLASDASMRSQPDSSHSTRLDTETLVSIARSESEQHLLAISKREVIAEPVTDVLLVTGNRTCCIRWSATSARVSPSSVSCNDRTIRTQFLPCGEPRQVDIPHIFLQVIAKASDEARRKLLLERTEAARDVEHMVCDVTGELHSIFGPASKSYYSARKTVSALHGAARW